jgi:hypothetical protein
MTSNSYKLLGSNSSISSTLLIIDLTKALILKL